MQNSRFSRDNSERPSDWIHINISCIEERLGTRIMAALLRTMKFNVKFHQSAEQALYNFSHASGEC